MKQSEREFAKLSKNLLKRLLVKSASSSRREIKNWIEYYDIFQSQLTAIIFSRTCALKTVLRISQEFTVSCLFKCLGNEIAHPSSHVLSDALGIITYPCVIKATRHSYSFQLSRNRYDHRISYRLPFDNLWATLSAIFYASRRQSKIFTYYLHYPEPSDSFEYRT